MCVGGFLLNLQNFSNVRCRSYFDLIERDRFSWREGGAVNQLVAPRVKKIKGGKVLELPLTGICSLLPHKEIRHKK